MKRILLLLLLLSIALVAQAAELPAADWYAVTWVEETDTLHWINENGEQASISRPQLPNELTTSNAHLRISPNGRYLAEALPLTNGRMGIGFYDFQTGQFLATHESEPNEVFMWTSAFDQYSNHFVIPLRNQVTNEWRIIVFNATTGAAEQQLHRTDPMMPAYDTTWMPNIAQLLFDEGINTLVVRFQMETVPDAFGPSPSLRWSIPNGNTPQTVQNDTLTYNASFDMQIFTGKTVFTGFSDPMQGNVVGNFIGMHDASDLPVNMLVTSNTYTLNSPQWLNSGEWVGYRVQNDGVHQPHFRVTSISNVNPVPLGPNIGGIYDTPDGFLAVNSLDWVMYHATDLNMEGFAYSFGTTVFDPGFSFAVIYTTPVSGFFSLTHIEQSLLGGSGDLLAPSVACDGAPAPRMIVGGSGMISQNGTGPLNMRIAPGGELITQLQEGTLFVVVGGSECVNGYLWWQIQTDGNPIGWVAEGEPGEYYIEPVTVDLGSVAAPVTATPGNPPRATSPTVPPVIVARPTAAPTMPSRAVICSLSPASRVSVGMTATTSQADGTLAMRINLTDEIPTYQLPVGQVVQIIGGAQCRNDLRMWQISTTLNGQAINGWVAEGANGSYYLTPNP